MINGKDPSGRMAAWRGRALLGTALAAMFGGALVASGTFPPNRPALADPVSVQPVQAPSFADLVAKAAPAVVSIRVDENPQVTSGQDFIGPDSNNDPLQGLPDNSPLRRFFGGPGQNQFGDPNQNQGGPQGAQGGVALGSGFFISDDGYVVTNNHVVNNASNFKVTTSDGTEYDAKLVGTDASTDLAVLKVDASKKFAYVAWAKSQPRVGDWVVAIGNPFGLGGTVTAGIISAEGRQIDSGPYDDYLQIDAPVNRGNSGGPTFDTAGEVIGINTAIFSPSGGSVGIGFDIPASVAAPIVAALENHGAVTRGWLGVQIQPLDQNLADSLKLPNTSGALVADAEVGSPAEAAGIKARDVILSVDGKIVTNPQDLAIVIASDQPNSNVDVSVWRDGAQHDITVKLGTLPNTDQTAQNQGSQRGNGAGTNDTALASLGMTIAPSPGQDGSVVIASVAPNGAAENAGLSQGEQILSVGDTMVASTADVQNAVNAAKQAGTRDVLMRVRSGQNSQFVAIPIG